MSAPADVGRTRFQDGMRVAREHLDHLQDVLLDAVHHARETGGVGKVIFGLRVSADGAGAVRIGAGAAVDRAGRLLSSPDEASLALGDGSPLYLVIRHALRSAGLVKGIPTLLFDNVAFEARTAVPPYGDDAVVFARIDGGKVTQRGDWYLPPLDHTHSGAFVEHAGRWRYDGDRVGMPSARYDSGWVADADVTLAHGLASDDLVVQLQARRDGVVTIAGLGGAYWYELPDADHIRLVRSGEGELQLRAVAWPLDPAVAGPPLADPGPDQIVEPGVTFTLDGSRSRASGGHRIVKFIWTQTS